MLETIATLIGFFGAALITFSAAWSGPNYSVRRPLAIIGAALIIVAVVLLILILAGVTK